MEMQQVRYFLAVTRTFNFTRGAEECNVTQPALTRAIKQLEEELGGELIRREGRNSHLTPLGERMRPLLQQCYESATTAKKLACRIKNGEVSALSLAISWTVSVDYLMPQLDKLQSMYPGIRIKLRRGTEREISQMLRDGDADLAISGPLDESWDRLETWPMFTEAFDLVVGTEHQLARHNDADVSITMVRDSRFLSYTGIDYDKFEVSTLDELGIDAEAAHRVDCARDLETLVAANFGVTLMPKSTLTSSRVRHITLCHTPAGIDLRRTVAIYSVAGRPRSREAGVFLNLVRSTDWPRVIASKLL